MNEKIRGFLKNSGVKLIVVLGLAGMVLILFSDIFSSDKKTVQKDTEQEMIVTDYESYVSGMEKRLEGTLEKISGVGKVQVMITAAGSGEYIYAKDEKTDTDESRISKDEKYVVIGGGGDKKALVRKIANPEIMGVVVVCEGGESNVVKEKVYKAVAAALGIPSQKIFVAGS